MYIKEPGATGEEPDISRKNLSLLELPKKFATSS